MCSLGIEPTTFVLLMQCSNYGGTGTPQGCMLLCFLALIGSVLLLSIEGQKALGFNQKLWVWKNDRIFIFG